MFWVRSWGCQSGIKTRQVLTRPNHTLVRVGSRQDILSASPMSMFAKAQPNS